jgi:hypothetical protein
VWKTSETYLLTIESFYCSTAKVATVGIHVADDMKNIFNMPTKNKYY